MNGALNVSFKEKVINKTKTTSVYLWNINRQHVWPASAVLSKHTQTENSRCYLIIDPCTCSASQLPYCFCVCLCECWYHEVSLYRITPQLLSFYKIQSHVRARGGHRGKIRWERGKLVKSQERRERWEAKRRLLK